jgi:hypothetical protein
MPKKKPVVKLSRKELRAKIIHLLNCASIAHAANRDVTDAIARLPEEYEMAFKISMEPRARIHFEMNGEHVTRAAEKAIEKLVEVAAELGKEK